MDLHHAVNGIFADLGVGVLAVPLFVDIHIAETEIRAEIDDFDILFHASSHKGL